MYPNNKRGDPISLPRQLLAGKPFQNTKNAAIWLAFISERCNHPGKTVTSSHLPLFALSRFYFYNTQSPDRAPLLAAWVWQELVVPELYKSPDCQSFTIIEFKKKYVNGKLFYDFYRPGVKKQELLDTYLEELHARLPDSTPKSFTEALRWVRSECQTDLDLYIQFWDSFRLFRDANKPFFDQVVNTWSYIASRKVDDLPYLLPFPVNLPEHGETIFILVDEYLRRLDEANLWPKATGAFAADLHIGRNWILWQGGVFLSDRIISLSFTTLKDYEGSLENPPTSFRNNWKTTMVDSLRSRQGALPPVQSGSQSPYLSGMFLGPDKTDKSDAMWVKNFAHRETIGRLRLQNQARLAMSMIQSAEMRYNSFQLLFGIYISLATQP
ncbi:MAG: hypothetical protein Q9197_003028 [Variospora fuerteventurae]